jgi:hypothetical protein
MKQFRSLRPLLFVVTLLMCVGLIVPGEAAPTTARSTVAVDADVEALVFENGYSANIIGNGTARVLRSSQRNYTNTGWVRDLDYAITGYSLTLHDMSVMRENVELFLATTNDEGVVAETYDIILNRGVNSGAWDSMPNLIHASYVYAAKTGDRNWVANHITTLERIAGWITRLDTNGDGMPDRDIFPYGYYDTVQNSVMHTFALAKFYGAYREMASLQRMIGRDGSQYEERARRIRAGFHLPTAAGGYWPANQAWPIAWRKADGRVFNVLETFGVFQAAQDGLLGPEDGWRYRNLMAVLHGALPTLIGGPTPSKLALEGYPLTVRRDIVPPANNWMLDASAPWIAGIHAPAAAAADYPEDAQQVLAAYSRMVRAVSPPTVEFASGANARYGPGDSGDRGRTWDNAAWFAAIYGGHFGLRMTPEALVVAPDPIRQVAGDRVDNFMYQGALVSLELDAANRVYRLSTDRSINVRLGPVGDGATIVVDGEPRGPRYAMPLSAGQSVYVQTLGQTTNRADPAFEQVWRRADAPVQRGEATRSWLWGPVPFRTTAEPYAEAPGGYRQVDYYDKARMEITRPGGNRDDRYFVTNGLLVKELVSGSLQTGDATFETRAPSDVPVAGDPGAANPAPPYRVWEPYVSLNQDRRATTRVGQTVSATIDTAGVLGDDPSLARPETRIAVFEETLGHNIPDVFWRFLQAQQDDWLFAFGYPISEPYWSVARVGGVDKRVLVQLFERRALTYTPGNPAGFEVEMGNVGQHYHQWRYGFQPWDYFGQNY